MTGIAHDLKDHTLKSEPKSNKMLSRGFVSSVRDNESIRNMTWNVIGSVINSSQLFQGDLQVTLGTEALDPEYSDETARLRPLAQLWVGIRVKCTIHKIWSVDATSKLTTHLLSEQ